MLKRLWGIAHVEKGGVVYWQTVHGDGLAGLWEFLLVFLFTHFQEAPTPDAASNKLLSHPLKVYPHLFTTIK